MRNGGQPRLVGSWLPGVRVDQLAILLFVVVSAVSWLVFRSLGSQGLVLLSGGLLGGIVALVLLVRFPFVIGLLWFLTMSGLQTVGMIRMPGLPDFSLTRLALMMVVLVGAIAVVTGRRLPGRPWAPAVLLILHALYVLLNMHFAGMDSRFHTWLGSSFAPIVGYLFAKNFVNEERHLRALVIAFVIFSVYFWVTCIGEKFEIEAIVWPKAILDRDLGISWFGRSRGPFLQPGITGQFLGWYMMAQAYLLTRRLSPTVKALIVLNIVMSAIGTFLTYTRGPWLATVVGFLVMAFLRPRFRKYIAIAAVAGGMLVATSALQPSEDEFLGERLSNTSTIENRLGFLAAATRMIQEHPLFGVGYFRYLDLLPEYNQGTYIPLYGYVARGAGKAVPIHDMFIGRAAEEGLVSLALILWLLVVLWFIFWKRWREVSAGSWFDREFLALYAGMMASYFVNGMTLDYRYFDFVNVLPMFMSGIVVGFPLLARGESLPVAEVATIGPRMGKPDGCV